MRPVPVSRGFAAVPPASGNTGIIGGGPDPPLTIIVCCAPRPMARVAKTAAAETNQNGARMENSFYLLELRRRRGVRVCPCFVKSLQIGACGADRDCGPHGDHRFRSAASAAKSHR